ncbi:hypothetical protein [Psychrobacillus sp. FSL K6-2843]|uniref:hypothetical protein n=1 Tax=Psychrobacillus sp. FSL K6-2843 TaxID=2921549 RepID=UPI00315AFC2C
MSELSMQFQQSQQGGVVGQATASREMEEVKGAIFLAKQFPRNIFQAEQRILDSCKRTSLAEVAMYQYPRGGTKVSGPSIRLAEVLAQNWGNLSFGVKELEQREGESVAMAYAWDLETNVRQEKVFTVKHSRQAKGTLQKLTDPRDIYELVASSGARRVRACVLGIIPGDIVDKAVAECEQTLKGNNKGPLKDRISKALKTFKEQHRVTQEMVEAKFGYNAESFTEYDYLELIKIFNSIKDGMSKVEDWFNKDEGKKKSSDLGEAFKKEDVKEVTVDGNSTTSTETSVEQSELPQQ